MYNYENNTQVLSFMNVLTMNCHINTFKNLETPKPYMSE
jgi:hypothetical protein